MKTYTPDFEQINYPTITKLAFQKCVELGLTEYEKWALFDFDIDNWAEHLEFILNATKTELEDAVESLSEGFVDNEGNPVDEKSWSEDQ